MQHPGACAGRGSPSPPWSSAAGCGGDAGPRPLPAATLVAEARDRITAFAVDDDFVYWGDSAGGETSNGARVLRAPREGGAPEVLASGGTIVAQLLSGAETLYWTDGDGSFSCMRLHAMDKATGAIVDLSADPLASCALQPVAEYKGKLLVIADDPSDGTTQGRLYRVDPTGATPPEPSVRFGTTIDHHAGTSRTGPSLYVAHREDCGLRVFRADLDSFSEAPAFTWDLPQTSGFVVLPVEGAYWVSQRYVDRSDLHLGFGSGLDEGVLASFEGGVGGVPLVDGDDLWLDAPGATDATKGYARLTRATGAIERFETSLLPSIQVVGPEGLYLVVDHRIYLQPRP